MQFNLFILKYFIQQIPDGAWWIGLLQTDTAHEPAGGWDWMNDAYSVNKTTSDTTPWHSGEPDNSGGNQDCGILFYLANELGNDDSQCENKLFYICEIAAA